NIGSVSTAVVGDRSDTTAAAGPLELASIASGATSFGPHDAGAHVGLEREAVVDERDADRRLVRVHHVASAPPSEGIAVARWCVGMMAQPAVQILAIVGNSGGQSGIGI